MRSSNEAIRLAQRSIGWQWSPVIPAMTSDGSFDYFVGAQQYVSRHFDAKRPGRFEIDDQIEPRGHYDGQIGWPITLENPCGIYAELPVSVRKI